MEKKLVGSVSHYFNKAGVAVVQLSGDLKVGDRVSFEGGHSFEQTVDSMQVEHKSIAEAKKGQAIGMKTADHVREGYQVYKITE
jgi:translation elongation factor EF-1alpha